MKGSTGVILIAIGLLALYIVMSDKYACFVQFIDCLTGNDYRTPEGYTRSVQPAGVLTPPIAPGGTGSTDIFGLLRGARDIFKGGGQPPYVMR